MRAGRLRRPRRAGQCPSPRYGGRNVPTAARPKPLDPAQDPGLHLDGRRTVVTGAGRGTGLALAAQLADAGAAVTLSARSTAEIQAGAAAIRDAGGQAEATVLDVSDLAAVVAFFAGRPGFDVLVNNAGINRPKPVTAVLEADYDAVLNLESALFVAQASV